jgi:uncharacterized membrane protein YebE (DUF533 family)
MSGKKEGSSVGAVGAGAVAGGLVGAKIGIAGFFGAISGVVPLAIAGAYLGHKAYKALNGGALDDLREGAKQGFAEETAKAQTLRAKREALGATRVRAPRLKPPPKQ